MRKLARAVVGAAVVLFATGCYHATIETGLPAGTDMVSKAWASGWLFGLVPPSTVETASKCKNGVAKVETQHSFLNMLAYEITFGLWAPMQIDVTCASSNRMSSAGSAGIRAVGDSFEARRAAIEKAVALASHTGQAVYVTF